MTDLSRRSFLKGALVVSAIAAVPLAASTKVHFWHYAVYPQLIGDGITDDWAALQAWADGKKVICEGQFLQRKENETSLLNNGYFKISRTLVFHNNNLKNAPFFIRNCHFNFSGNDKYVLDFRTNNNTNVILNNYINYNNPI